MITSGDLVEIGGWVGSLAVLGAYALVSANKLKSGSLSYQFLNLFGAMLLVINTTYHSAYPSAFLNALWSGVALMAILKTRVAAS